MTFLFFIMRFAYSLAAGMAFWFGEPAPSRQYVAEYNAEVLALSETESAWRLVREAAMMPPPLIEGAKYPEMGIQATVPEDPLWPAIVKAGEANRARLALAFEVVKRGRIGMPLVVFHSAATPEQNWAMLDHVDPQANPSPLEVSLPHLAQVRKWARELASDCRIASEAGDADRVVRDLVTMQKLAELLPEPPLLISQLVDFAVNSLVAREVGILLASYPGLLNQEQLEELAASLKQTRARLQAVDFEWEWAVLLDWIGRVYSDDGRGNGVVTHSGLAAAGHTETMPMEARIVGLVVGALIGVDSSGAIGSRRELLERLHATRDAIGKDIETKPWLREKWSVDATVREDGSDMKQLEDFPLAILVPGLKSFVEAWNGVSNQLDVAILVTELERYRLATGDYPRLLSDLARVEPNGVPSDFVDGRPIRFVYRDGGTPVLYSIGVDGVDDGGRAAEDNDAAGRISSKKKWATGSELDKGRLKGDHIYWPPVSVQWIDGGEQPFQPRRILSKP